MVGAESVEKEVAGAVQHGFGGVGAGEGASAAAEPGEEEGGRDGVVEEVEAATGEEAVEAGGDDAVEGALVAAFLAGGVSARGHGAREEPV